MHKSVLLLTLSLVAPSALLAQNLPDEIDHVRYGNVLAGLRDRLQAAQGRLDNLTAERSALQSELQSMRGERDNLPGRNAELERLINQREAEDASLEGEIRQLNGQIARLNQDVARMDGVYRSTYQSWQGEDQRRVQLANEVARLDAEAREIRARWEREARAEEQSGQRVQALEQNLERLRGREREIERDRRQLNERQDRFQRELPTAQAAQRQAAQELAASRQRAQAAQQEVNSAAQAVQARQAEVAQAEARLAPFQARVNETRQAVQRLTQAIAPAEREVTQAQAAVAGLEQRRQQATTTIAQLENQIATLTREIEAARPNIATTEAAKNEAVATFEARQGELRQLHLDLRGAAGNRPEILRIQGLIRQKEQEVNAAQQAVVQTTNAWNAARAAVGQRESGIARANQQLAEQRNFLSTADTQIQQARARVTQLEGNLQGQRQQLERARNDQQGAEAALAQASTERDRLLPALQQARQTAQAATQRRDAANAEVERDERQERQAAGRVQEMERSIAQFPREMQQIERALQENQREENRTAREYEQERQQLRRLSDIRVRTQRQVEEWDAAVAQAARNLSAQEGVVETWRARLDGIEGERNQLLAQVRSAQEAAEARGAEQQNLRAQNQTDTAEIARNRQRLAALTREIPARESRLTQVERDLRSAQAETASLGNQVETADGQFRERLSLFQRHLAAAREQGTTRATTAGRADGEAQGLTAAQASATRLATQSATDEARFEALLRAFVRGEISGHAAGRAEGLASTEDAARGTQEGTAAGIREARNRAEQELKPRFYGEAFQRLLQDPEVRDEVRTQLAAPAPLWASESRVAKSRAAVPAPLTAAELAAAAALATPLDQRIDAATRGLVDIRRTQTDLRRPEGAYVAPGAQRPTVGATVCQGVYKNVAEFVTACRDAYTTEYRDVYGEAHRRVFVAQYPGLFAQTLTSTLNAEIERQYPALNREAVGVAHAVGLALGKQEVFAARFAAARDASFNQQMPGEEARVSQEAQAQATNHFQQNAVIGLQEAPRLASAARWGVAPGNPLSLELFLKNAGHRASVDGAVQVRVVEASPQLVVAQQTAPVAGLAARRLGRTRPNLGLQVAASAEAGQRVRLVADLVFPGHDYQGSRTQRVEILETLAANPTAQLGVQFNNNPEQASWRGAVFIHDVTVNITAQYAGLSRPYQVTLQEVGSSYVDNHTPTAASAVLRQGQSQEVRVRYKLKRSAKGRTINLRLLVAYDGQTVEERTLQISVKR